MKKPDPYDFDGRTWPTIDRGTELFIDSYKKRLAGNTCPYCKKLVDGATRVGYECTPPVPEPGLFTVCIYCGGLSMFTADLKLRVVDRKERRQILRSRPEVRKLLETIAWSIRQYRNQIQ